MTGEDNSSSQEVYEQERDGPLEGSCSPTVATRAKLAGVLLLIFGGYAVGIIALGPFFAAGFQRLSSLDGRVHGTVEQLSQATFPERVNYLLRCRFMDRNQTPDAVFLLLRSGSRQVVRASSRSKNDYGAPTWLDGNENNNSCPST